MNESPHTNEAAFNQALGDVLRRKHPLWRQRLQVEQTKVLLDRPELRPDILVTAPDCQPVVVETEWHPAHQVEADAKERLGLIPQDGREPIEQAIALRIPRTLDGLQADLNGRIAQDDFEWCMLAAAAEGASIRRPSSGWMRGDVDDLARCVELAMASPRLVSRGASILKNGVLGAAAAIRDAGDDGFADIEAGFGRILNQRGGEQTNRMAMAIIANAMTFHSMIAGSHDIPTLDALSDRHGLELRQLLDVWRQILDEINYWPIFKVAIELLERIRRPTALRVLDCLRCATEELAGIGIAARHDLSGAMFQNLIANRKFLATFYTLPESAALLAELAVERLGVDWEDQEACGRLRIADLSCGTGTLISAAYHAALARHRLAGGDDSEIHRRMIEQSVVAADIMPAAAHLCATQLASAHPTVLFGRTQVFTMPYGIGAGAERERSLAIGSLELIPTARSEALFATGVRRVHGEEGDLPNECVDLPANSADLIIMNPPFTRPTNHESTSVPVPSFAGFQATADEQKKMAAHLMRLCAGLENRAGQGNAGLASNFIDLAHAKAKPGGTVALVLPITAVQGASWQSARSLLTEHYADVTVITIAAAGKFDRAFSADTGMAEALVLATKRDGGARDGDDTVLFVNLRKRPDSLVSAWECAQAIKRLPDQRNGVFRVGDESVPLGNFMRVPMWEGGCAALRECALAETMMKLRQGCLSMPRLTCGQEVPVTTLGALGRRGPMHRDIGHKNASNPGEPPFRGPFRVVPAERTPNYPILWEHNADQERTLLVQPDAEGEVRSGCDRRASELWESAASHLHFTLDFQLNSQSLAACLTPTPVIGGRAWPGFKANQPEWEKPLALWANCTLGLMAFWWEGARQQQGRSVMTITNLPNLMTLDPRNLSSAQIGLASEVSDRFQRSALKPANESYRDDNRKALDQAMLVEVLGLPETVLGPLDNLRLQWCSEPSVHGGKSTQPEAA